MLRCHTIFHRFCRIFFAYLALSFCSIFLFSAYSRSFDWFRTVIKLSIRISAVIHTVWNWRWNYIIANKTWRHAWRRQWWYSDAFGYKITSMLPGLSCMNYFQASFLLVLPKQQNLAHSVAFWNIFFSSMRLFNSVKQHFLHQHLLDGMSSTSTQRYEFMWSICRLSIHRHNNLILCLNNNKFTCQLDRSATRTWQWCIKLIFSKSIRGPWRFRMICLSACLLSCSIFAMFVRITYAPQTDDVADSCDSLLHVTDIPKSNVSLPASSPENISSESEFVIVESDGIFSF